MLLTDRRGKVVLERVSENKAPQRHYHFGENGLEETYSFSSMDRPIISGASGRPTLRIVVTTCLIWATGRVSGRPPEPHLTLAELEVLWK